MSRAATAGAGRKGVCPGLRSKRGVRERSWGDFGGGVCASGLGGRAKRNEKRKSGIEKWSSVDGKLRNAADPGRPRRRRRFQTRKTWLLFLAFSTYSTRIAAPGPMLASIQIVHLRASSTPVYNKNQHVTQSPTRQGNSGTGFDLTPPPDDFFPEARTKRC